MTDWKTGLFDFTDDIWTTCYGFWCCPCLAVTLSGSFGENRWLPIFDILSLSALTAMGIPLAVPPAGLALRVAMRKKYGIQGTLCNDILISCFCETCAWCQMQREFNHREGRSTAPVITQPARQ